MQLRDQAFYLIYLAVVLIVILSFLAFGYPDEAVKGLLIAAATAFVGKIQTVYDYLFGSSSGSKSKDALLLNAAPPTNPAQ